MHFFGEDQEIEGNISQNMINVQNYFESCKDQGPVFTLWNKKMEKFESATTMLLLIFTEKVKKRHIVTFLKLSGNKKHILIYFLIGDGYTTKKCGMQKRWGVQNYAHFYTLKYKKFTVSGVSILK